MTSVAAAVRKACVSSITHCWSLRFGNNVYAVMQAHGAIFQTNNRWKKSHFMKGMLHHDWLITPNFTKAREHHDDFIYTELKGENVDANIPLDICLTKSLDPEKVTFFFKQPYDSKGTHCKQSSLGAVDGWVYPSPNSDMLEAVNIGFRGMSGALVMNAENKVAGIFIRRGEPLGTDKNASSIHNDFVKFPPISRAMVLPCAKMLEIIQSGVCVPLDSVISKPASA